MTPSEIEARDLPVVGSHCHRTVRFSQAQISEFARLTGDANPAHADEDAARRAHHGRIIASGQQTAAQMIGLAATHGARGDDGRTRDVLCLNFNFAFKAPVFADEDLDLRWTVSAVEWAEHLGGAICHLDGTASADGRPCVVGRGTLLVKPVGEALP
jgi:acyl dehydratase